MEVFVQIIQVTRAFGYIAKISAIKLWEVETGIGMQRLLGRIIINDVCF